MSKPKKYVPMGKPAFVTDASSPVTQEEDFEQWLDRQLTGDLATGNLETELRMAVSTIRDMPNIPKDFAVQPLKRFIEAYKDNAVEEKLNTLKEVVTLLGLCESDSDKVLRWASNHIASLHMTNAQDTAAPEVKSNTLNKEK